MKRRGKRQRCSGYWFGGRRRCHRMTASITGLCPNHRTPEDLRAVQVTKAVTSQMRPKENE